MRGLTGSTSVRDRLTYAITTDDRAREAVKPRAGVPLGKDFGILEKCPYCPKTDIRKTAEVQFTCGGGGCRRARANDMRRKSKTYTTDDIKALLGESMIWPEGLEARELYKRLHDDHDGTYQGSIVVVIGEDGDAWVDLTGKRPCTSLRYRTGIGGGSSLRVRNALLLLAFAIKLENEEHPVEFEKRSKKA